MRIIVNLIYNFKGAIVAVLYINTQPPYTERFHLSITLS